jgi:uncharacterized membrane protein
MKKRYLGTVVMVAVVLLSIALQFVTGSLKVSTDFFAPFMGSLIAVILVRWYKRKNGHELVDERLRSVFAKADSVTMVVMILGCLVGSNVAAAFSPYYPELKIVCATLLGVIIAAGVVRFAAYGWYERKMS